MSTMYEIYIEQDGSGTKKLFYKSGVEDIGLANVIYSPTIGSAGTLSFTVPYSHPYYSEIEPLKTDFWLYKNGEAIFRGRYVGSTEDFYRTGSITCEGDLNFLCDSIQEPYSFTGSIGGFLAYIISRHNDNVEDRKKFYIGNVTVVDENNYINRSNDDYSSTAETIKSKLVEVHGGYLRVRYSDERAYLDYVTDYGGTNSQVIRFGTNLIDISKQIDASSIITCLYPIGASIDAPKYSDENTKAQNIQTAEKTDDDGEDAPKEQSLSITTNSTATYLIVLYYASTCENTEYALRQSIKITNNATGVTYGIGDFLTLPRSFTVKNPLIKDDDDAMIAYIRCSANTPYTVTLLADKKFMVACADTHPLVGETYAFASRVTDVNDVVWECITDITTPEVWHESHWKKLGSDLEGAAEKLDISLVNNGKKYITSSEGIAKWGQIWGSYEWSETTDPTNLLEKAEAYLEEQIVLPESFTLTAVDLSLIDASVSDFRIGYWTTVVSTPQGISGTYLLKQANIDISNPENSTITLGGNITSLSSTVARTTLDASRKIQQLANDTSMWINDAINNATDLIRGGLGGYVVMNSNPVTGYPDEILIMDAPTTSDAQNVIRLNKNGIGFSTSGYNGTYHNAWTIDGHLVADYITTGSMSAERIRGGALSLGGSEAGKYKNGQLAVYDENNNVIGTWTKDGITIDQGAINIGGNTWDKNGITISNGTITGANIQTASSGARIVMDTKQSIRGYYNNTLGNVISMMQPQNGKSESHLTIDALHQINIRAPRIAVETESHGEDSSTGTVCLNSSNKYQCVTGKYYADESPVEGQQIIEANWAYVDPSTMEVIGYMYATLPAILKMQDKSETYMNGFLVGTETSKIYAL